MEKIAKLALNEDFIITGGKEEIVKIINSNEVVNFHCQKCNTSMTFARQLPSYGGKFVCYCNCLGDFYIQKYEIFSYDKENDKIQYKESSTDSTFKEFRYEQIYFVYNYICPKNGCYTNIIQFFSIKDNKVKKIFQSCEDEAVSPKDMKILTRLKYLSKNDANELYKANILHRQGMHVASYVYLRRVLENIFRGVYEKNKMNITIIEDGAFEKLESKVKINYLSPYLPSIANTKKASDEKYSQIFKLLSEGIHNLTEDEALEYFRLLSQMLIVILEKLREDEEQQANSKLIDTAFDAVFNKKKKGEK